LLAGKVEDSEMAFQNGIWQNILFVFFIPCDIEYVKIDQQMQ
jgi:hypothetical protein